MLRELESLNPPANLCSLYDTMNVILERKLNLPVKEFENEVDTVLQMFEKKSPRETNFPEMARFYLNKERAPWTISSHRPKINCFLFYS